VNQSNHPVDVLILGGLVVTMDAPGTVIEDGAVAIRGSDIVDVGLTSALSRRYQENAHQVIDAGGRIVMPGLVNAQTRGAETLFRGLLDDLPVESSEERLAELETEFANPESARTGALLAYAQMIRGGTTTALDASWFPESSAEAAKEIGFRLVTGPTWFDSSTIDGLGSVERNQQGREFMQQYRRDPLVTPCVLPHSAYTVSPSQLEQARALAEEFGCLISIKVAETQVEVGKVFEQYRRRPAEHLDRLGMLGPRTLLTHCVHLDRGEIDMLSDRRGVIVHCPVSNLKQGSGIAPLPGWRRAGVRVGLGTDGAASSSDLDMWWSLRMTGILHKGVHLDPALITSREVVSMATRGNAAALGKGDEIGSIETGKRADIILLRIDQPHGVPLYDAYSYLAYSAGRGDVETVMIHGQIVLQNGQLATVDETETLAEARALADKIRAVA